MKKYFGLSILTLLFVSMMAVSAFAAASPTLNAGNTTIASEKVAAAGQAINAVNTGYEVGGAVAATSQLKLTLTNGTFTGGKVTICDNTGTTFGVGTTTLNGTTVTITTVKPMTTGQVYNFQPTNNTCTVAPTPLNNIRIASGAVGGTVVSLTVDDALNPGNTQIFATAPIVTLVDQFSVVVTTPVTSTISFAGLMKNFLTTGTSSTAVVNILSNETIQNKVATGHAGSNTTCALFPATAESITWTVTPGSGTTMGTGFAATTAFQMGATGTTFAVDGTIASTDTSATGAATINGNLAAATCGAGSSSTARTAAGMFVNAILNVDGTTVLTSRSYKLAAATNGGGAVVAGARSLLAATTAWTWSLDASQYYIPLIGSNTAAGRETYIKLQSKNVSAGSNGVSIAILDNQGGTTATWTGSITAGTPLTVTGEQLIAAATAAGKTVSGTAGFAVIVTVNAPRADVFIYANMTDSAGAKRVPVQYYTVTARAAGVPDIYE